MIVHHIWEEFLKIMREEAGNQIVETWFKAVSFEKWDLTTTHVTLKAPNQFVKNWIEEHYIPLLKTHLSRLLNTKTISVSFENSHQDTVERTIIPASVATNDYMATHTQKSMAVATTAQTNTLEKRGGTTKNALNSSYIFDNFVVGPNNSLAHAASWAICENLGCLYNPLFIYGGTGLGKTHLLHALGNEAKSRYPSLTIRYETADNFINEFINSIRFDRIHQFRNKYQKVDVFLFDDIQFLSNKEQTQETFFHIFNDLYEQQKQIVLSSDTFPQEITGLQNRLRSRMGWGLVADIQMPDLETKIAILKKKSDQHRICMPDDVADFIASRVISNVRELEGALVRVAAFGSLTNQPITLSLAHKVLLNFKEKEPATNHTSAHLDDVLKIVARHFDMSIADLRSKKRSKDIACVRQVACYVLKKHTENSLQAIGAYIGGRNHSTVIHAIGKVEDMLAKDGGFAQKLKRIEQELSGS